MYYKIKIDKLGDRAESILAIRRVYDCSFVEAGDMLDLLLANIDSEKRYFKSPWRYHYNALSDDHEISYLDLATINNKFYGTGTSLIVEEYKSDEEIEQEKEDNRFIELQKWRDGLPTDLKAKVNEWVNLNIERNPSYYEE